MRSLFSGGPGLYKSYPGATRISLPALPHLEGLPVEEAIEKRRSLRDYSGKPLSLLEISHLLHYSCGITDDQYGFRAAPSAGALFPIEVYPAVNLVEGLVPGIYHYSVPDHSLELLRQGEFRREMVGYALGQLMLWEANVVFIMTAVFDRSRWKYQERTERYVFLEAGHIAQNMCLVATSLSLGACAIGAFFDDKFNRLLGLDSTQESTIYLVTVGKTV